MDGNLTAITTPEFKPVKLRLKIDLVSYPARAEGLVNSTTPGQSRPVRYDNERRLHIPLSSSITGALPSDSLMSYPRHSLAVGCVLPFCRDAVGVFYSPNHFKVAFI